MKKLFTILLAVLIIGVFSYGLMKYIDYRFNSIENQLEIENNKNFSVIQDTFQTKIENLEEMVDTLKKINSTDKELLKKYSKIYFLNENYFPVSLSDISKEYRSIKSTNFQIHSGVLPYLEKVINDSNLENLTLKPLSAYRSFITQTNLKASYKMIFGTGANKFSADQGFSEHQLGTVVDFSTIKLNGELEGFDKTPEYKWLLANAYKYGFVISYPEGNTYYKFEPWHWRFVGIVLATKLHDDNLYFSDLDQRTIDSYLPNIFN